MRDIIPDFPPGSAGSGEENGAGDGFRASQALNVVVGYLGGKSCHKPRPIKILIQPSRRRYAHGRAVSVAAVWVRVVIEQPAVKAPAVSGIRIQPSPVLHTINQLLPDILRVRRLRVQKGVRDGDRHHGIVREAEVPVRWSGRDKQREPLCLDPGIELIGRADDVSEYRSVHCSTFFPGIV